jgi:hypothetical protein
MDTSLAEGLLMMVLNAVICISLPRVLTLLQSNLTNRNVGFKSDEQEARPTY